VSRRTGGFTYVGLLLFIALMGAGLAILGQVWATYLQREKERELLFIGREYQRALTLYYQKNGGLPDRHPKKLEDLLYDGNQLPPQRYLRKVYRDPMTGSAAWGLVKTEADGIIGVYSLSEAEPLKKTGFPRGFVDFAEARQYADWKFMVVEDAGPNLAATPGKPPSGEPPPPAAEPPKPPPATPPKPKPPLDCARINAQDLAVCESQRARWGDETVNQCEQSAAARLSACIRGATSLPPLYIRYF
jgi:type II secretory pathway pseudopilin PulG